MMKRTYIFSLLCPFILLMLSCSESNEVAGGAIEDQNTVSIEDSKDTLGLSSSASAIVPDDTPSFYNIPYVARVMKFSSPASTNKIDYGYASISKYEAENGASGSCSSGSTILEGAVKIMGDTIATVFYGADLDSLLPSVTELVKNGCAAEGQSVFVDTLILKESSFEYACLIKTEYTEINGKAIKYLGDVLSQGCKNLNPTFGRYETLSSAFDDKMSSSDPVVESSSSFVPVQIPSESTSIDTALFTLDNYTAQYAPKEELSFDEHVLAYKGYVDMQCLEALGMVTKMEFGISMDVSPIAEIDLKNIPVCFPLAASVLDLSGRENSCKYYFVSDTDYSQPTGHVLSHVSHDSLVVTQIYPHGCETSQSITTVAFLVEDCDDIIDAHTKSKGKSATSKTWRCTADDSWNPRTQAISYGEWYRPLTP